MGVRELGEQRVDLVSEDVLLAVASPVQPPDLALAPGARQRLEHGEHRGCADPGAEQHDRPLAVPKHEAAAGGGRVDQVALVHVVVHVVAPHALRFELDADAEAVRVGDRGERVAADQRRLARAAGLQPEREVLAGSEAGTGCPLAGTSRSETTVLVSRSTDSTRSGSKPSQAALLCSLCSSSSRNEAFQPSLSAGMRSARSRVRGERFGRYRSPSMSATESCLAPSRSA